MSQICSSTSDENEDHTLPKDSARDGHFISHPFLAASSSVCCPGLCREGGGPGYRQMLTGCVSTRSLSFLYPLRKILEGLNVIQKQLDPDLDLDRWSGSASEECWSALHS